MEYVEFIGEIYICGEFWVQRPWKGAVCMWSILGSENTDRKGMYVESVK